MKFYEILTYLVLSKNKMLVRAEARMELVRVFWFKRFISDFNMKFPTVPDISHLSLKSRHSIVKRPTSETSFTCPKGSCLLVRLQRLLGMAKKSSSYEGLAPILRCLWQGQEDSRSIMQSVKCDEGRTMQVDSTCWAWLFFDKIETMDHLKALELRKPKMKPCIVSSFSNKFQQHFWQVARFKW